MSIVLCEDGDNAQKRCAKCHAWKEIDEFYRDRSKPDGRRNQCKVCVNQSNRLYVTRNVDMVRAIRRNYYEEHKEEIKANARHIDNIERKREYDRNYAKNNKTKIAARLAQWKSENPDYMLEWYSRNPGYDREWKRRNPEKVKLSSAKQYAKRKEKPQARLEASMKAGIVKGIAKGAKSCRKTFSLLGYTLAELMAHLERQFKPGMTWENYGRGGWHIDHKVPLSAHSYTTPEDIGFKKAWALNNLQPLWGFENMSKGAKLYPEFQTAV